MIVATLPSIAWVVSKELTNDPREDIIYELVAFLVTCNVFPSSARSEEVALVSCADTGIVYNNGIAGNGSANKIDMIVVVDGGIVPTSLGVNSSLTISALAFRIAENIVGLSNLPVEPVTIDTKTMYFSR